MDAVRLSEGHGGPARARMADPVRARDDALPLPDPEGSHAGWRGAGADRSLRIDALLAVPVSAARPVPLGHPGAGHGRCRTLPVPPEAPPLGRKGCRVDSAPTAPGLAAG